MAYTSYSFKDYPDKTTPLTAANLNKIDSNISEVEKQVLNISGFLPTTATVKSDGNLYAHYSGRSYGLQKGTSFYPFQQDVLVLDPTDTSCPYTHRTYTANGNTYIEWNLSSHATAYQELDTYNVYADVVGFEFKSTASTSVSSYFDNEVYNESVTFDDETCLLTYRTKYTNSTSKYTITTKFNSTLPVLTVLL